MLLWWSWVHDRNVVSFLSKRLQTQNFCCRGWGIQTYSCTAFSVSCPLEFQIYLHSANLGPNELVLVCCQMCVWVQHIMLMFCCSWYSWDYAPVTHHWIVLTSVKQLKKRRGQNKNLICRQSIENKVTLLWLLDRVPFKKT